MPDLWPDDIAVAAERLPQTPKAILHEQAHALFEKTRGVVHGRVRTRQNGDNIEHVFVLYAPALDYQYDLLGALHNIVELYPVRIDAVSVLPQFVVKAKDEEELKHQLEKVFAADRTRKIVAAMIAQSRA